MILITGNEPIVDGVCSALDSLGRSHRRVDTLDAGNAWEEGATTVMLLEPLPRMVGSLSVSERGLREVISAANAPGARSAVIVTPRPGVDAEPRRPRPVARWRARLGRWFGARTFDAPMTNRVPAPA